jgi:hypothetical protein
VHALRGNRGRRSSDHTSRHDGRCTRTYTDGARGTEVDSLQSSGALENADAIMSRPLSKNKRDVIEFSMVLRGFEPAATKVVYFDWEPMGGLCRFVPGILVYA